MFASYGPMKEIRADYKRANFWLSQFIFVILRVYQLFNFQVTVNWGDFAIADDFAELPQLVKNYVVHIKSIWC